MCLFRPLYIVVQGWLVRSQEEAAMEGLAPHHQAGLEPSS